MAATPEQVRELLERLVGNFQSISSYGPIHAPYNGLPSDPKGDRASGFEGVGTNLLLRIIRLDESKRKPYAAPPDSDYIELIAEFPIFDSKNITAVTSEEVQAAMRKAAESPRVALFYGNSTNDRYGLALFDLQQGRVSRSLGFMGHEEIFSRIQGNPLEQALPALINDIFQMRGVPPSATGRVY
ncbi:hypothetical protein HYV81_02720 [Candidatus Woesearchaeota archaeon]|nr:hypothetical protein [Candidatus Woesearchaeota archaeon]